MSSKLGMPLTVDTVTFPNRVFGAPMSGVSDLPFRRRVVAHGAGAAFAEMSSTAHLLGAMRDDQARRRGIAGVPNVVQIAGRNPADLAEAARICEAQGADLIDINMGCPAKKVTGGYAGSALLLEIPLALKIVEAVARAVRIPVTLKTRLGWDRDALNAGELVRSAEDAGARMITLHARTRCQFYKGQADWRAAASVRAQTRLPFVINGDIVDLESVKAAVAACGADAVMVGRGLYGAPWRAGSITAQASGEVAAFSAPETGVQQLDYILQHHRELLAHYGAERGIRHARKHLGWYLAEFGLSIADNERLALMEADSAGEVEARLIAAFAPLLERERAAA